MASIKRIIFVLTSILFFFNFQIQKNRFVSYEFKIEKYGKDRVVFSIFLSPMDGIHVNSEPKPDVKFDNPNIEILNIKFEKTGKDYIDTSKPIKIDLKLKSKAITTLNGEFTYFYCSETEGWCSKGTNKFEIKLK